jgi:hypothetical protein
MQWFAFVILPIGIMIAGWIISEPIVRHDRREAASQAPKPDAK